MNPRYELIEKDGLRVWVPELAAEDLPGDVRTGKYKEF